MSAFGLVGFNIMEMAATLPTKHISAAISSEYEAVPASAADANSDRKLTLAEMQEYLSLKVPVQAARLDKKQVPQLSSEQLSEVWLEYR